MVIVGEIRRRRRILEELEEMYIKSSDADGTQRNKITHMNGYFEFCTFNNSKAFPVSEFKLVKFAAYMSKTMKTVESIKAYCSTVCQQNKLEGYKPVKRGLRYYKALTGIRKRLRHRVKHAQPMTVELLEEIEQIVNIADEKELVVWTALVTGFHLVIHKSNLVPIKRVHDMMHNIVRNDIKYTEGIMIIDVHWSKTNQFGEYLDNDPTVGNPDSAICPVSWLLYMMNTIPASGSHNLFCYCTSTDIVPITYRDLMVYMRHWLQLLGEDPSAFSSHSLRRGAATHAHNCNIPDSEIQCMGHWKSQCFTTYIEHDVRSKVKMSFKFNKML